MSYVKIWVHAVWGTKNRERILTKEVRQKLFQHIRKNAKDKNIYIDCISGEMEHIHCLLALNSDMSISKTMQLIKGEASHWANTNNLLNQKLDWADEYFAVSVSESVVDKVREYISNQDEHHKRTSFTEEYEEFMKKYRFESHG
jgi:REP element-mobilizing transposase RayT